MELELCLELRLEIERFVALDRYQSSSAAAVPHMEKEAREKYLDELQRQASPAWVAKEEDLRFQEIRKLILTRQGKA